MVPNPEQAKSIFLEAVEDHAPNERAKFLDEACGGNQALRDHVDALLRAYEEPNSMLDGEGAVATVGGYETPSIGTQIGPYSLREQIGEGGMGVVYVAEQTEPVQRKVALKVIKPGMDTKEVIARFEAERQALAFMEHPNIARVLDAGATESGRSYFVMELVRGIPITEYCDQVKATPRERLDLFQTVCDAVQHAHQKGIIHRDIKPSNVLVTQVGAKPVVKVIDFGLAKATSGQKLTNKTVYTGFMKLMGTPIYMSPEQAGLSGLDVDTRSDVYSLGVLLYELLTGTTPLDKTEIQKQAYDELCRQIREVEAPKPSSRISTLKDAERSTIAQQRGIEPKNLRQILDGDLDVVVLKALEKDRDRRYSSPQDLAADVDRFLANQPVLAVAPSSWYLARKYFRRHRLAILTAAAVAVSLLVAAGVSTWQAIRANNYADKVIVAKNEADVARDEAVASAQEAVGARRIADEAKVSAQQMARQRRRELYASDMETADHVWKSPTGSLRRVNELLTAWIPVDDSQEDMREFSWRYQWTRLHRSAAVTVRDTNAASVSADGNMLTADSKGVTEWDSSGTPTLLWSGDASEATLSPDGRWAAIPMGDNINLINIPLAEAVMEIPHDCCDFSSSGRFLAAWTANSEVDSLQSPEDAIPVWDLANDTPTRHGSLGTNGMEKLPFWASQLQLADDGTSYLELGTNPRSPNSHTESSFREGQSAPVKWYYLHSAVSCAFSQDGKLIANGCGTGAIHLRLRSDPTNDLVIRMQGRWPRVLCFSPDGSRLVIGGVGRSRDGIINVWDVSGLGDLTELTSSTRVPELLRSIKAHSSAVSSVAFSPDGSRLVTHGAGGESKLWDLGGVAGRYEVKNMGEGLLSGHVGLVFKEDDAVVAQIIPERHEVVSGEIHVGDRVTEVSDERNGTTDVSTEPVRNSYMAKRSIMYRVIAGEHESTVRLKVENHNQKPRHVELRRTHLQSPRSMDVCFSHDGTTVAVADQYIGGASLNRITKQTRRLRVIGNSIAASNGKLLALTDWTDVVLWDMQLNREHGRLDARLSNFEAKSGKHSGVGAGKLAFSPDGRFLALGTGYRFNAAPRSDLKIWQLSNLEEVGPQFQNDSNIADVRFTSDSSRLIACDQRGVVRIWHTSNWELERTIQGTGMRVMALSHDNSMLATGGGAPVILDLKSGEKLHILDNGTTGALAFLGDDKTLAVGSFDNSVVLWDVRSGKRLQSIDVHTAAVFGIAVSPDGNTLATLGSEGVLRLWDADPFEEIESHPATLNALFELGTLRNSQERYAEAEVILRRLREIQVEHLGADDPDVSKTRSEIAKSLTAQGKMPVITGQPASTTGTVGDEIKFSVELADGEPSDLQWYRNGKPIEGATSLELAFKFENESDFGAYHLEAAPAGRSDVAPVRSEFAFLLEHEVDENRGLRWEFFDNIPGREISNLTEAESFQNNQPDEQSIIQDFEITSSDSEEYGGRITGVLIPPVTGEYVFYLCSDDYGQLFLNSNSESPDGEEMIAHSFTNSKRMWQSAAPGRSKLARSHPIHLRRGKRYSIRALYNNVGKYDHLEVTWQMPGQRPPENGDSPIPSLFLRHSPE